MEIFKIFVDRLQDGHSAEIHSDVNPGFLAVDDGGLVFDKKVSVRGRAYLAEDHLIITLNVKTAYKAWCRICNELVSFPIDLEDLYLTEEVQNIPSKIYDFQEPLREAVLLEIPMYHECGGNCPERVHLQQFLANN